LIAGLVIYGSCILSTAARFGMWIYRIASCVHCSHF
jgi:hypothetical protein